jgi:hypothetical protein
MKKEYQLTLSPEQANVLVKALDLYSRVLMGQLEEVVNIIPHSGKAYEHATGEDRQTARELIRQVKDYLFKLSAGSFHGIHSDDIGESPKVAWDLLQVIRHHLSWDEAGWPQERTIDMLTTNFDEPMRSSETEPLATIKSTHGRGHQTKTF